jgi:MoxR-like ATPase
VRLARMTRRGKEDVPEFIRDYVSWGAGPRASQYLVLAAKARAILSGRFVASVEDVRALARPVLRHRVLPNFTAESEGITSVKLVDQLVAMVKG